MKNNFTLGKYQIEIGKIENENVDITIHYFGSYETFHLNEKTVNKLFAALITDKWEQMEEENMMFFHFSTEEDLDPKMKINIPLDKLNVLNTIKKIKQFNDEMAEVYIALPQKKIDLKTIENIQNCCGDIMEALGYELEQKEEPVFGSFFQKLRFKLIGPKTEAEITEGFEKAKQALEAKYIKLPTAESTEKLTNATANLIVALKDVDEGVLRLGSLLIVKHGVGGKVKVYSETLSPQLSTFFDENPQILKDPNTVYSLLNSLKSNPNLFKETDGVSNTIIE